MAAPSRPRYPVPDPGPGPGSAPTQRSAATKSTRTCHVPLPSFDEARALDRDPSNLRLDSDADFPRTLLETSSGKVESWFWTPTVESEGLAPALIFAHGNGEVIDHWAAGLDRFREMGMAVMLVEYPGYGRSAGTPTEESITESIVAGYDALAARPEVDRDRIVGFGQSLGGGAVCALSRKRRLTALILLSTFTSIKPLSARFLMPALLVRDTFDNLQAIRSFAGPVLVIHGRSDSLVPLRHATQLAGATSNSTLVVYECGHWCWYPETTPIWGDMHRFLRDNALVPGP